MKVIFLAAGSGRRLEEYTQNLPKALVKINDSSLIDLQIKLLKKNKIFKIIIVRGYKKEQFSIKDVEYIDDDEYSTHDQLGSLICALKEISGDVLIMFADIIFEQKILDQIINSNSDISIAVDQNWKTRYNQQENKQFPALVEIKNGKVISITEKQKNTSNQTAEFLGILKLSENGSRILVDTIVKVKDHIGKFHDSANFRTAKLTDILQEMIQSKQEVLPIFVDGKWVEIDTEDDLKIAKNIFC